MLSKVTGPMLRYTRRHQFENPRLFRVTEILVYIHYPLSKFNHISLFERISLDDIRNLYYYYLNKFINSSFWTATYKEKFEFIKVGCYAFASFHASYMFAPKVDFYRDARKRPMKVSNSVYFKTFTSNERNFGVIQKIILN